MTSSMSAPTSASASSQAAPFKSRPSHFELHLPSEWLLNPPNGMTPPGANIPSTSTVQSSDSVLWTADACHANEVYSSLYATQDSQYSGRPRSAMRTELYVTHFHFLRLLSATKLIWQRIRQLHTSRSTSTTSLHLPAVIPKKSPSNLLTSNAISTSRSSASTGMEKLWTSSLSRMSGNQLDELIDWMSSNLNGLGNDLSKLEVLLEKEERRKEQKLHRKKPRKTDKSLALPRVKDNDSGAELLAESKSPVAASASSAKSHPLSSPLDSSPAASASPSSVGDSDLLASAFSFSRAAFSLLPTFNRLLYFDYFTQVKNIRTEFDEFVGMRTRDRQRQQLSLDHRKFALAQSKKQTDEKDKIGNDTEREEKTATDLPIEEEEKRVDGQDSQLRNRFTASKSARDRLLSPNSFSLTSPSSSSAPAGSSALASALTREESVAADLESEVLEMTSQLKARALQLNSSLKKDDKILGGVASKFEMGVSHVKRENQRLKDMSSRACGQCCTVYALLLLCVGIFVLTYFLIRFFPVSSRYYYDRQASGPSSIDHATPYSTSNSPSPSPATYSHSTTSDSWWATWWPSLEWMLGFKHQAGPPPPQYDSRAEYIQRYRESGEHQHITQLQPE